MLMQPAAAALYGACRIKPRVGKMGQVWAAFWDFKDFYESMSERSLCPAPLAKYCVILGQPIKIFQRSIFLGEKS